MLTQKYNFIAEIEKSIDELFIFFQNKGFFKIENK